VNPLLLPALGLALGLAAGEAVGLSRAGIGLVLLAVGAGWLLVRSGGLRVGPLALFAAALLVGMLRAGPGLLDDARVGLEPHWGQQVTLSGRVIGLPEQVGGRVRVLVEAHAPGHGQVLAWADPAIPALAGRTFPYLLHGDALTLTGRLGAPTAGQGFDQAEHLAARGVGSVLSGATVHTAEAGQGGPAPTLHRVRAALARSLARALPEPVAGLAQALVLGLRGGLDPQVSDDFRRAGLAHLLAVSGMHVGLLLALGLAGAGALVGRRHGLHLLIALALVWGYVALAGAPPSAVRAGLMGSAVLAALALGRGASGLNLLAAAALVLLVLEPRTLWDRSFQLSFASLTGVLAVGLPLARRAGRLPGGPPVRWAAGGMAVSVGALALSAPLTAYNFSQAALWSAPATLLALPLLAPLLVSAGLAAVAGLVLPLAGTAVGLVALAAGGALVGIAQAFAALPGAGLVLPPIPGAAVWAAYGVLGCALALAWRRAWLPDARVLVTALWRGPATRWGQATVLGTALALALTPWALAASPGDGLLHAAYLDVGQGSAALLTTPGGAHVLIDGGPDPRTSVALVDARLPVLGRRVDLAIISHPHADHISGLLALARRGRIATVLAPPEVTEGDGGGEHLLAAWRMELERVGVAVVEARAGQRVTFTDGTVVEVLHPPAPPVDGSPSPVNDNGVVVRVRHGEAALLFTGDLTTVGESVLAASGQQVRARVLEGGHHGSASSFGAPLLEAVRPSVAVFSVGEGNPYGHPAPAALERVSRWVAPEHLFRTDQHGTVELAADGARWWVRTLD
jgi:competence protein ComEC